MKGFRLVRGGKHGRKLVVLVRCSGIRPLGLVNCVAVERVEVIILSF
jgi:hypothetical protein